MTMRIILTKKLRVNKLRGMLATFSSQSFLFLESKNARLNYIHIHWLPQINEFLRNVERNGMKVIQKV
jgi:hypothetical protein